MSAADLTAILAGLEPTENPYIAIATFVKEHGKPSATRESTSDVLLTVSFAPKPWLLPILTAIIILSFVGCFVCVSTLLGKVLLDRSTVWLCRMESTSNGRLIVLNGAVLWLAFSAMYA